MSGLGRASALMAAGTAVSRVLGFARAFALAAALGVVGLSADLFDVANKTPNILYMLLAGGVLNAVLVPAIVRASRADRGAEFVDRLLTLSVALLVVATVVMTLAAPLLVRLYSQYEDPDQLALATAFAYWCVPQLFFYGLYTVLGQVLNARQQFGAYMWAPALNNVVGIAGLVAFVVLFGLAPERGLPLETWTPGRIALVAGSATLGVACQALVLWWPLRAGGYRFRPRWGFRGVGFGTARTVALWTFAAVVVGQLGFLVTSNVSSLASRVAVGTADAGSTPGPAAYSLAFLLFMLPHSLVAVSLVTALFTRMSESARSQDWPAVRDDLTLGLRTVGVFTVPAAALLVALAVPAGVALGGTLPAGRAVGSVAAAMALGLPAFSAAYLLQRVFYAYEDARTPFLVTLPSTAVVVVVDLLSALLLPARWVVVGVGVGMSLSAVLSAVLAAVLLRRRHGRLRAAPVVRTYVRLLLAAVVAGLAAWAASTPLQPLVAGGKAGAALTCVVAGAVGALVYVAGLKVLHVAELDVAVRQVRRRLGR